jgi:DNA-binding CsgD family transcriptional regulator/tetratricopeptide (TPR) repeat protein
MSGPRADGNRTDGDSGFVGRVEQLALTLRRWDGTASGAGHFLFVAGEAGIGKTRLLREFGQRVSHARQITTSVFPRDIETVGGVLIDLAAELSRAGDAGAAGALRDRLTSRPDHPGDASRGRRLLASELAMIVCGELERRTLLFLEDLHWADELSLDVLERVAGALSTTNSLIVATYRSDELYPRTPLRRVRARLLEQRLAEEIRLPPLNEDETAQLIRFIGGNVDSSQEVHSLFDRSGGIPLYVEELVADTSGAVPETIADAISMQTEVLSSETMSVLEAAAVIGRSFDVDLLACVAGVDSPAVDHALAELAERNLVLVSSDGATLDFRHALIRDAVYEAMAPLRKRGLHAVVARAAVSAGFSDAFISDQFERAREPAGAYRHATAAARDAVRVSSHREAVELFRRAERTAPIDIDSAERAALHGELARMLEATDDNSGAATQYAAAIELLRAAGSEVEAARLVPRLAAVDHLLGFDFGRRTAILDEELRRLDALKEPVPAVVRAGIFAASAAAHMLERRLDEALVVGAEAAAIAVGPESSEVSLDVDMTIGTVLTFAGRGEEGWPILESTITRASDARLEATAARGYRMLGTSASVLVEYPRARTWLSAGLDYTALTERWNDHHYIAAHGAHVDWATGDWAAAQSTAARVLTDGASGITTRNVAATVLGYLALGRGEHESAREYLDVARRIGDTMHELQRLLPPLWGLAELELLSGSPAHAIELCELAFSLSEPLGDAAYLYPFLTTGTRAYLTVRDSAAAERWCTRSSALVQLRDIPGTRPATAHAQWLLQLAAGQTGAARLLLEEARDGWRERDRFWDAIRATVDLAHCAIRSRRPRDAVSLVADAREHATAAGATTLLGLVDAIAIDSEKGGLLSPRELDVARLVADGATNRQIAERLVISPKTASSHVEHILAKLSASRRSEIAAWVTRTRS